MSDKVGAIPLELISFPSSVQGETAPLNGAANRLNTAIEALNSAPKTPGLMGPVPYAGNSILGYVTKNGVLDAWVAKVGDAFARAEAGSIPAGGNIFTEIAAIIKGLDTRATSTNSNIAAQAGSNPLAAADQAAAGTEAGSQLKEGVATKSQPLVDSALKQLGDHQGQGPFNVHFFQALGPNGTLDAVPMVSAAPNGLQTFDGGLATATKSAGWDNGFNSTLFKLQGDPALQAPDHRTLALLQYGSYSTDFLTKAADNWLFHANPSQYRGSSQVPDAIFAALARNPAAAANWLAGNVPFGDVKDSRMGALVGPGSNNIWQQIMLGQPAEQAAFNKLLEAVGQNTHNPEQLNTILQAIVNGDWFAGQLRPGTTSIIVHNIGLFMPKNPDQFVPADWVWQEKLFKFVESPSGGQIDQQTVAEIQKAIGQWAATHAPRGFADNSSSRDAWNTYLGQVAVVWALSALPVRQAPYDAVASHNSLVTLVSQAIGFIPFSSVFPGAARQFVANELILLGEDVASNKAAQTNQGADSQAVKTEYTQLGTMDVVLTTQFLSEHPGLLPKGADVKQWITNIAEGNPPPMPDGHAEPNLINQFRTDLKAAESNFLLQYNNPGRG